MSVGMSMAAKSIPRTAELSSVVIIDIPLVGEERNKLKMKYLDRVVPIFEFLGR